MTNCLKILLLECDKRYLCSIRFFRTLKYLMTHLNKVAQHSARTGMTDRNLAIVWAPNLLRSPSLEMGGVAALRGVGVQAVVTGRQKIGDSAELMYFH